MIGGKPVFVFTPNETATVLSDIGRSDVAAVGFVEDVQMCLQAFDFAATGGMSSGLPKDTSANLAAVVHAAAVLRSALYGLPDDIAMLIDLHLLSEGARRRVAGDLARLVEPLEDIAGAIVEIQRNARGDALEQGARLEDRLVRALAAVFRNRLNRAAGPDDDSGFPVTLHHILEFAGHRLPRIAAMRAAVTPARLRELVGEFARTGRRAQTRA